MKKFNSPKPKHSYLFQPTIFLTNILHKRCMDFTYEVICDQNVNPIAHDWIGDF
jgi:hypothetical protein